MEYAGLVLSVKLVRCGVPDGQPIGFAGRPAAVKSFLSYRYPPAGRGGAASGWGRHWALPRSASVPWNWNRSRRRPAGAIAGTRYDAAGMSLVNR